MDTAADRLRAALRESMEMDPPPKGPPTNIPEVAQAIRDSRTEPRRNPKRARSTRNKPR